jgi:hypothetical protein
MNRMADSGSFLRRRADLPVMVLSQDYELFFGKSGTIEKCLFEPTDKLVAWAKGRNVPITFYVDAGMLVAMEREAKREPSLAKDLSQVKSHVESLAQQGHEIGLHIHPHWEDTGRVSGAWDFARTRYKLDDFRDDEIADIVSRYAGVLNDLCDGDVTSYRAGGFCVEPFGRLRPHLEMVGIDTDSSVVPGLAIEDPEKGVRFRSSLDRPWWYFSASPTQPEEHGAWVEVPITPQVLPFFHYWGRALDRVLKRQPPTVSGDGSSKRIGQREILRRLAGWGRTSELSSDAAKAAQLETGHVSKQMRDVWHIMGHPKLVGDVSITALEKFIDRMEIGHSATVAEVAAAVRAQHP